MIGPLLIVAGLLGFWALAKGKASGVIDALTQTGFSTSLQNALGDLQLGTTHAANIPGASGPSSASNGSGNAGGTALFNVPINGPNGSGIGAIQVVAHDAASAIINASQGGNTAIGPATHV